MEINKKFLCSKTFIYFSLLFPVILVFLINQKIFFSAIRTIRRMTEEDDRDYLKNLCKKYEDLYDFYYEDGTYIPSDVDFGKMDESSNIILEFLNNDYASKYIFKYLWYTNKYTAFYVILLLIIIFSIYYNISSFIRFCSGRCCNFFSFSFCKNKYLKIAACIIAPILYMLVLIIAAISMSYSLASLDRFAGTLCVGFQLVDSLILGETRNKTHKWGGIDLVNDILLNLAEITKQNNQEFVNIIYENKKLYDEQIVNWNKKINESYYKSLNKSMIIKDPKTENIEERYINLKPFYAYNWEYILFLIDNSDINLFEKVKIVFDIIENYLYEFLGCKEMENKSMHCEENSKMSKLFEQGANLITYLKKPLSNFRNILVKPIENIYEGINNVLYYFFVIIIIFLGIYCGIILLVLGAFFWSKIFKNDQDIRNCIRWNLCHIYFISLIMVIVGLIVGIGIGLIGNLVKDLTNVVEYISSSENLRSDNPMIFGKSNVTNYLDVCLNGDGNLAKELKLEDNFDFINNITNITDESYDLTNMTNNKTSFVIDYCMIAVEYLINNYLETQYINIDNNTFYNLYEKLNEINNYVSGYYSEKKTTCDLINEHWDIIKEGDEYIYNNTYPPASEDKNYFIYLYDEDVYNQSHILTDRYINACPSPGKPYETVNEASQNFGKLFYDIKKQILSDKFNKEYLDDLNELNKIYGNKNMYINKAIIEIKKFLVKLDGFLHYYSTNKDGIFSLLNCKFVGENKIILMSVLYSSLGVYLDKYGTLTSLWSLFLFIGLIFVTIVIRNNENDNVDSNKKENINNLKQGKLIELHLKSEGNQKLLNS